jgi:hypothetical protein
MAPILPGLGLGEQEGDQPAEHGDRGISQLGGQLDARVSHRRSVRAERRIFNVVTPCVEFSPPQWRK